MREPPAIVRDAERLLRDVERAVQRFSRAHKYQTGADLRREAKAVAVLVHRAWWNKARRAEYVEQLVEAIDQLKVTMKLGQQIDAFSSFGQFEDLWRVLSGIGRQCGGWQERSRSTRQNARASAPGQRPSILSSHGAHEASL